MRLYNDGSTTSIIDSLLAMTISAGDQLNFNAAGNINITPDANINLTTTGFGDDIVIFCGW